MRRAAALAAGLVLLAFGSLRGESPPTAPPPATAAAAPAATLADLAWLAGHWLGDGLGGVSEEVWLPARGGAMLGSFRQLRDDQVVFYELLTLAPNAEGVLELRIKHFHSDLKGWEERDQVQAWALSKVEGDAFHFGPILFRRMGAAGLEVTVTMKLKDGSRKDEVFRFRRVE